MSLHSIDLLIPTDHPAFAGHFPGAPIVPGVVLLDEALHAIGLTLGRDLSACRVASAKFLSPVAPGDALKLSYESPTAGASGLRFEIESGARRIATVAIQYDAS